MTETTETGVITPVIITCSGAVHSKPRLVRRRESQTPLEECEFVLKFREDVYPDHEIPNVANESVVRKYEDKILSLFSVEGIYTDKDGVIRQFEKPDNRIWWIEVRAISTKQLKTIPFPPERESFEGPIIEGEVVPTEPIQE
jgi:hypothetical protein